MDLRFNNNDAVQWWDSDSAPLSPEGSPLTPASDLSDRSLFNPLWLSSAKDNSLWAGYPSLGPQGFMENPTLPSNPYNLPGADFVFDLPELGGEGVPSYMSMANAAPASLDKTEPTIKTEDLSAETISMPELDIEEQLSCSPASSHDSALDMLDADSRLQRVPRSGSGAKTRSGNGLKRERPEAASSPRALTKSAKVKCETEKSRAKTNHNDIERKYRNRLSSQFEMLLAVLNKADEGADNERTPQHHSKAEVLAMARGRIRSLEKKNHLQMREMERLRREIVRLQVSAMLPISPMAMGPGAPSQ